MFKVGDAIKWMCPLDNDYTYGEITALRKSVATVKGTGLYSGITAEVHLRYIEKLGFLFKRYIHKMLNLV